MAGANDRSMQLQSFKSHLAEKQHFLFGAGASKSCGPVLDAFVKVAAPGYRTLNS
jgi:hypothetical protein